MFGNDLSQHRGKQVSPLRPFWWLSPPPCPVGSMSYDTESQSRNVLASPLGEEGHEVAKGVQANWIHRGAPRPANPVRRHPAKSVWTRGRMIMTLDMDVTAEGGIIKLIAP